MTPLHEIRTLLLAALGGEAMFRLVNARQSLRTGVDLSAIRPEDDERKSAAGEVLSALEAMGFRLETLRLAAQAKQRAP